MRDASTVVTRKLYDEDAYLAEFSAEVVSFSGTDLVLDRTAFFPEEGGQYPDQGEIEGFAVCDVQIRDGEIHHELVISKEEEVRAAALFEAGRAVHGRIDFELRYSNMQMHSGEHLFSGLVHRHTGYDNVGFHLSPNEMTMDFEGPISRELLQQIEEEANEAVFRNLPSEIVVLRTEEERNSMDYRSKIDLTSEVRVVIYPGIDACACCAPHVRSTGEIGLIKVVSVQNWKGGVRVSLVCGRRAGRLLRHEHELLNQTAAVLSSSVEDVCGLVVRAREENRELKRRIRELGQALLLAKADALPKEQEHVLLFEREVDAKAARETVNRLVERHRGYSAVLIRSGANSWNYVIGSGSRDCRIVSTLLREQLGARGGGTAEMTQGSVTASEEEIRDVFGRL